MEGIDGIDGRVPVGPGITNSQVVFCVVEFDPDAYSACGDIDTMLTPALDYMLVKPGSQYDTWPV